MTVSLVDSQRVRATLLRVDRLSGFGLCLRCPVLANGMLSRDHTKSQPRPEGQGQLSASHTQHHSKGGYNVVVPSNKSDYRNTSLREISKLASKALSSPNGKDFLLFVTYLFGHQDRNDHYFIAKFHRYVHCA